MRSHLDLLVLFEIQTRHNHMHQNAAFSNNTALLTELSREEQQIEYAIKDVYAAARGIRETSQRAV